ncbi:MAG TPA: segregation/condensation protein A [Candidatus Sulfomarinibacteraceae bacterium]|nr:segregation/condensation protein A [Candidatus Sulfomarinibacteraceae bacterium]
MTELAIPTAPGVRFGAGRRPEQATQVSLETWDGPLGLLLSLIEARRLDVLTVPLGALAEAYLDALAGLADDRIGNISSFVAVASQLILIKSRAILPRQPAPGEPGALVDEGPDPESALRARLLLYRAYRDAGLALQATASTRVGLFRREPGAAQAAAIAGARAPDAPPLPVDLLVTALDGLVAIIVPPELPAETIARTVTLAQRAEIIRDALRGVPAIVLQELLSGVRDRVVVAVTFLAMLELVKRREIVVEQADPFGPIVARRTTPKERAAGSGGGADDAPIDESLASFR